MCGSRAATKKKIDDNNKHLDNNKKEIKYHKKALLLEENQVQSTGRDVTIVFRKNTIEELKKKRKILKIKSGRLIRVLYDFENPSDSDSSDSDSSDSDSSDSDSSDSDSSDSDPSDSESSDGEEKNKKTVDEHASALFITAEQIHGSPYRGAYKDSVYHHNDGDVTVLVRGQRTGRDDHKIHTAITNQEKVYVMSRAKKSDGFTYIGRGRVSVDRPRTIPVGNETDNTDEMCLFRIYIDKQSVVNEKCAEPVINEKTQKKIGGLRHIGFQHTYIQTCFYRK